MMWPFWSVALAKSRRALSRLGRVALAASTLRSVTVFSSWWNCKISDWSAGLPPLAPPSTNITRSSSIRPRPPNTLRVFSSKSWFSSRTALQLRMRWSVVLVRLNIPSSGMVCRGPLSNDQVTLSVRPSTWHTMQPPQTSCDMRLSGPRPVKNSSAPSCTTASGVPFAGSGAAAAVETMV
jgi:hypothetical protein